MVNNLPSSTGETAGFLHHQHDGLQEEDTVVVMMTWMILFDVYHGWSTNPPGPRTPPQKKGFNKALLRETNG